MQTTTILIGAMAALCTAAAWRDDPLSEASLLAQSALGQHVKLRPEQLAAVKSFSPTDRFVVTYYFTWYDHPTGEHFRNADGSDALTDHPLHPETVSYRSAAWHRKEMLDMADAGIDVILPVHWGAPPDVPAKFEGHYAGLAPMVEAARQLAAEGKRPPRIGMFYDTSSLSPSGNIARHHVDLSTNDGKAWLYVTIRDYFSAVPPDLWAAIGGRPIVFLYGAGSAKGGTDDPEVFRYVRRHFARDFGGAEPYIVADHSWRTPGDAGYDWGAAFTPRGYGVACVGPGYDDHPVPGRTSPKIEREGGARYIRSWEKVLAMDPATRPRIAAVETWNELHEGTDICETREYGRRYIELTRGFAARWKAGERARSAGPYAGRRSVTSTFGPGSRDGGVRLVSNGDGLFREASAAGSACIETVPNKANGEQFLYFDVDDSFYWEPSGPVSVSLECLDEGGGTVGITYDSTDPTPQFAGAYKQANPLPRGNSGAWRVFEFRLTDVRFANRQNAFTDFRASAGGTTLKVRRVTIARQR
jgi:hypothetical protein